VLPRPHTARKGVPVEQQDTHHICVRARLAARGRQTCQIHIVYVSARLFIRRVSGTHKFVPRTYCISIQSTTARSESLGSYRARSHPGRTRTRALFNPTLPIRRRRTEPCVSFSSGSIGSSVPLLPVEDGGCPCPPPGKVSVWTDFSFFETSPGSDLPAPLASAVLEHAVDLPAPSGFDGNQKKEEAPPPSTVSASSSNRASGDVKIPKWLKLGSSKSLSMRRSPCLRCNFFSLLRKVTPYTPDGIINSPLHPLSRDRQCPVVATSCCTHCRNTVTPIDTPVDFICHPPNYAHMYSISVCQVVISKQETQGRRRGTTRAVRRLDL
jgi:hypothetical protein